MTTHHEGDVTDEYLRLRNLAQSHAHEAHRIADNSRDAGLIHAHLAIAYALLAREERP